MVDFSKIKLKTRAEREAEEAARPLCVVFTGARDWSFLSPVQATVKRLVEAGMARCAHGKARGLDALVDAEARLHVGLHVERYPADWSQGRAAGIHRNYHMLLREEPHLTVAFPSAKSVGTWHCAVASHCPALVSLLGAGVREAIATTAREFEIDFATQRAQAVEAWAGEEVRKTVAKGLGTLSWPAIKMPDPSKAWVLLTPSHWKGNPRTQAAIDALLDRKPAPAPDETADP